MRVAIFTDNDFEKVNGVTTTLRAVLQHAPEGMDLRIYTCESIGIESPEYLALAAPGLRIPYYRQIKVYVPPIRRFLRHVAADGVDLVHLTTPGPVGLAALWVAYRLGMPMVGSFHTDLAEYARMLTGSKYLGDFVHWYMQWPYGRCEQIFVPSEATRDLLVRSAIPPSRISFWRRGVSTVQFDPAKRSQSLRDRWGVSDACPAILYVGRLSREKGLDCLAPFTRALEDAGLPHRLVVVGGGPMGEELRAACGRAVFTGTLSPEEVAVAMASSDLFLFPSCTDTAGNVILEAQASGLPVLVTDRGGPCENMRPGKTGFVCRSPQEFLQRTIELLGDSGYRRQAFAAEARHYAFTRRWDVALDPLYRAYEIVGAPEHPLPVRAPAVA